MIVLLLIFSDLSPNDKLKDSKKRKLIELSAGVGDTRFHKVILLSILIHLHIEINRKSFSRFCFVSTYFNKKKDKKSIKEKKKKITNIYIYMTSRVILFACLSFLVFKYEMNNQQQ